jgi:hypothetical protein
MAGLSMFKQSVHRILWGHTEHLQEQMMMTVVY